jgi:hypothetical protein
MRLKRSRLASLQTSAWRLMDEGAMAPGTPLETYIVSTVDIDTIELYVYLNLT